MTGAPFDLAGDEGLWSVLDRVCREHPDRVALHHRCGAGWATVTYADLAARVARVRTRLRDHGLDADHRLVVMGDTGPGWVLADLAALGLGATVVPVYPTSSPAQVAHIVATTAPTMAVADSDDRLATLAGAGTGTLLSLDDLDRPDVPETPPSPDVTPTDVATVVFTSGTTGAPKGCVLTHRNVYGGTANVAAAASELFARPDGTPPRTVLALPLAHMYGRGTLLATLLAGGETVLVGHPNELPDAMAHRAPTYLSLTPYLLDKLTDVPADLEYVICGGASLPVERHAAFRRLGVTILGAYGMTESAGAAAITRPGTERIGSVGQANPGTALTLDDGELILTGTNVSPGYWGEIDPAVVGPGPFAVRTGDCGEIDADGFVWITGRRKDILVTTSGKNVAPGPLEDRVRAEPLIRQCLVVGDQRPYVGALIAVDAAAAHRDGLSDADVHAAVQQAVDAANALVSRAESIRRFRIVTGDFTVASGRLTASGKPVRARILADYASEVQALYR